MWEVARWMIPQSFRTTLVPHAPVATNPAYPEVRTRPQALTLDSSLANQANPERTQPLIQGRMRSESTTACMD